MTSPGPRRRVVFVIPTLGGGGAEQILIQWLDFYRRARGLAFAVDPVVVFSMRKEGPYVEDLPAGIETHELGPDPGAMLPFDVLTGAWELGALYRRLKPDLVVSIITHASVMALLAARLFAPRTKVVVCEQTMLSTNIRDFYPRAHPLLNVLIRGLYPSARRIVAVTEAVKADLAANFGLAAAAVDVVCNPIDSESVRRRAAEPVEERGLPPAPRILGVGRFVKQKGFVHLIRAAARVREQLDASLLLVGDGPLRADLEGEARRLGLSGSVRFAGFQKNPIRYMPGACAMAVPSLYEAQGIALMEALAAGLPVVATDCSGPRAIIEDGVSGLLVPPGDESALAAALLRLLRDPGLRRDLARRGLRRAEDFSVAAHLEAYDRIFAAAMAG
ncbi:MAG: glycosyltransferase [Elusimicrobia bacterium]|nr:glycosyltransferase [Elusimicrobiota bacterium]